MSAPGVSAGQVVPDLSGAKSAVVEMRVGTGQGEAEESHLKAIGAENLSPW